MEKKYIETNGKSICIDISKNRSFWTRFTDGEWEPETFLVLDSIITPGSTVVDLGAWVGPVTLYAAHTAGCVHSFEPDPVAFDRLKTNVSLNPELEKKIELHNVAIGDHDGEIELFSTWFGGSGSSIFSEKDHEFEDGIGVKKRDKKTLVQMLDAAKLSQIIDFEPVSLIKMDTEGSEFFVLPRMKEIFERFRPSVWLSLHPGSVRGFGSVFLDRLKKLEFLCRSLQVFEGYKAFLPIDGKLEEIDATDWLNFSLQLIGDPTKSLKGDPVLFHYPK